MERKNFAPGALTAPLPPALVTVGEGEEENVLTVAWTGILSSTPPRTYVSVRPSRHSYALLKKYREFVLHLPPDTLAKTVDYCGVFTGAKVNKFEKCGLTRVKSAVVGAPTIAECPIAIECRVTEIKESGSHDIFFADIVNVSVDGAILDESGKIRYDKAHLCAYAHGEYYTLGKKIGTFGFSAAKKRKQKSAKGQAASNKNRQSGFSSNGGSDGLKGINKQEKPESFKKPTAFSSQNKQGKPKYGPAKVSEHAPAKGDKK